MENTKKNFWKLLAIILGFFMALLDTTIVNITLPKMMNHFDASFQLISWVVNGYNLAFAVLLITASRIADQFGRKKIFMMGVFLFTLTSFLSGVSASANMLIFFRVLQGMSAAFVVPITMPLMVQIFPPQKRGMVMGIWGAFAGLAAASGPALGGILTESFNWQSIFFINLPIGVLCLTLTYFLIEDSKDPTSTRKIDWLGILLLSVTLFSLTLSLIEANSKGWSSPFILGLFATAFIGFIAFILVELKSKEPMLPLSIFRILPFSAGSFTLFMLGIGMMSGSFLLTFFLVQVLGMTELQAGLAITAMPLTSMVCSSLSGYFSDKFGSRYFSATGMAILSLAVFSFSKLTADASHFELTWRLMLAGAGMGMTMSPTTGATIRNVPKERVGSASGVTNTSRTIGTVLGVALLVMMLNNHIQDEMVSAKEKAVGLIQSSTVLSPDAKTQLATPIKNAKLSQSKKPPQLSDVLKKIDRAEKVSLDSAPPAAKDKIKAAFAAQKAETERLWPMISKCFQDAIVTSFSKSFQFGSGILLIGVFSAFFSDRSRKERKATA